MFAIVRDFITILRTGIFEHRLYARVYLGGLYAAPFALLHYLLRGEAEGANPCLFFDPAFYRAAQGSKGRGNLFAGFLRSGDAGPPCAAFDPDWYRAHTPGIASSKLSPWRHFQKHGLAGWHDPAPNISLRFIFITYTKHRSHRVGRKLYEILATQNPLPPLTPAALKQSQTNFRAQIRLEVQQALPQRRHNNLVFVQTSGSHPASIEAGRAYDLMLNHYAPLVAAREADYVLAQRGTKVTAIDTILRQQPDLLLRYDHTLFLDDDVEMDAAAINDFFSIMERCELDLAQPALTTDSVASFKELLVQPDGAPVRPFNCVEIMAPSLSSRALQHCGWVFGVGISGFGVDMLLGAEVHKQFGNTVAVINTITARHARPQDRQDGAFYRYMAANSINPMVELYVLLEEHNIPLAITAL
ncbi:MAG: hypothetical protein POG74_05040 [Acidocella sp.]|nr:hypothetical protein [Acidocella sp.]